MTQIVTVRDNTYVLRSIDMVEDRTAPKDTASWRNLQGRPLRQVLVHFAGSTWQGVPRPAVISDADADAIVTAFSASSIFRRCGSYLINDGRVAGWQDWRTSKQHQPGVYIQFEGGNSLWIDPTAGAEFVDGFAVPAAASERQDSMPRYGIGIRTGTASWAMLHGPLGSLQALKAMIAENSEERILELSASGDPKVLFRWDSQASRWVQP